MKFVNMAHDIHRKEVFENQIGKNHDISAPPKRI